MKLYENMSKTERSCVENKLRKQRVEAKKKRKKFIYNNEK